MKLQFRSTARSRVYGPGALANSLGQRAWNPLCCHYCFASLWLHRGSTVDHIT